MILLEIQLNQLIIVYLLEKVWISIKLKFMVNSTSRQESAKEFADKYLPNQIVTSMKVNAKMGKKEMDMGDKFIVMEITILVFGKMIRKTEKERKFILKQEKSKKEYGKMENLKVELLVYYFHILSLNIINLF